MRLIDAEKGYCMETYCTLSAERRVDMAVCEKCKSSNVIESESGQYCCNCGWNSVKKDYVKKQTNADRIRAMSDEELAEYLDNNFCHRYCCGEREQQATLEWLQSEAEE